MTLSVTPNYSGDHNEEASCLINMATVKRQLNPHKNTKIYKHHAKVRF